MVCVHNHIHDMYTHVHYLQIVHMTYVNVGCSECLLYLHIYIMLISYGITYIHMGCRDAVAADAESAVCVSVLCRWGECSVCVCVCVCVCNACASVCTYCANTDFLIWQCVVCCFVLCTCGTRACVMCVCVCVIIYVRVCMCHYSLRQSLCGDLKNQDSISLLWRRRCRMRWWREWVW
jgi:hypothetical protein